MSSGSVSVWEAIFMLVVLKIPVVYLALVVWWAIRAEPGAGDGGQPELAFVPLTPCGWDEWRRRREARRAGRRPPRPTGGRSAVLRARPIVSRHGSSGRSSRGDVVHSRSEPGGRRT